MQRRSGYRRQVGLHSAFGGTSSSAVRERPVAGPVYVLGASALAPLRSSPRGLQPLLLDKVHNRHDRGRLRQLDAELLHDRPEVRQELIERLLALPDIEDLELAVFAEA